MGVGSIPGGIIFVRISSVGISGNSFCTYLAVSLAGLQLFKIVLLAVQNIVAPQPNWKRPRINGRKMQIKKAFSLYSLFVDHYPFRMNDTCVVASLYILINSARTSIRSTTLFYLSLNGSVVGCLLTTTGCWMHLLIKHKRPTADSHKQRRLHFLLLLFLLLYLSVFFAFLFLFTSGGGGLRYS